MRLDPSATIRSRVDPERPVVVHPGIRTPGVRRVRALPDDRHGAGAPRAGSRDALRTEPRRALRRRYALPHHPAALVRDLSPARGARPDPRAPTPRRGIRQRRADGAAARGARGRRAHRLRELAAPPAPQGVPPAMDAPHRRALDRVSALHRRRAHSPRAPQAPGTEASGCPFRRHAAARRGPRALERDTRGFPRPLSATRSHASVRKRRGAGPTVSCRCCGRSWSSR